MTSTAVTRTGTQPRPAFAADDAPLHPRPHPTRYLTGTLALAVVAFIVYSFSQGQIDWHVVGDYLFSSELRSAFLNTVLISVLAMLMGIAIGTVFAMMRLSSNPVTSTVAWGYVWLFRGTPVLLQLLMWFNIALVFPSLSLPGLFHIETIEVMTPFVAALLGLGINEGAYLTETIRGGLLSVDPGQAEAAAAIGLSKWTTMTRIVLPQAMTAIIPPIGNEAIGMLKTSALAAIISYGELLSTSQQIYYVNGRVMELLVVAACWYLVATSVTSVGQYYVEQKFSKSRVRRRSMADRMIISVIRRVRRSEPTRSDPENVVATSVPRVPRPTEATPDSNEEESSS
ncbi:amino acid ABC transporter permease [Jatrophihabitans cynanchi]|jgi:polar amino acid transport system permease protein|uniref:Amino acid ABC transporter permease n=1 Tax=Jatrophihabitans cynanchi TaxID=2944128 RepID=A0ABY7K4A2_9ACTN|nr:amino acid ABC transporter permease [Jatrophihabitans sp. SB3-54]WAX59015.1 amino acid ABC transporter permease [Jatrophihabitans sp. SB3-54]